MKLGAYHAHDVVKLEAHHDVVELGAHHRRYLGEILYLGEKFRGAPHGDWPASSGENDSHLVHPY